MFDPGRGTDPSAAILKAWEHYIAATQLLLDRFNNPAAAGAPMTWPAFTAWQAFARSVGMPGEFANGGDFNPVDMIAGAAPALGLTREYQMIVQRMVDLGNQFQSRFAEFLRQSASISEQALQSVQKHAGANADPAWSPSRAYDAWIDSAEAAYAQAAHGEAFAQTLGELCNLTSAFKVERGKLLEAFAKHLDLPSRAEVDSLHRQVRELTRAARIAHPPQPARTGARRKPRRRGTP